jgi:hypothetical protein
MHMRCGSSCIYWTFTNSAFCPQSVFMCFVWISEQTAIISLYSINWLVFITETDCVYCVVRTVALESPVVTVRTASLTFNNSTFCPHSVFMCFVWISEQIAIISLYSINWLVFITETECVYCPVRAGSLNVTEANLKVSTPVHTQSEPTRTQFKSQCTKLHRTPDMCRCEFTSSSG